MPVGIPVTVVLHLSACLVLQAPVGVMASELAVEAHVREVAAIQAAAEFVRTDNVSDEIPRAAEVGSDLVILMTRSPRPGLPLLFSTAGMLWS